MKDFLIDYFKDPDSFITLQRDFQKQDYYHDMDSGFDPGFDKNLIKEEFSISKRIYTAYEEDPYNTSFKIEKYFFYRDFLPITINKISSNYLGDFYNYIREDLLEDQKKRRKFLNEQKKSIANIYDNLSQFDFMGSVNFNELKAQIIEIEKAVYSPTLYNDKYISADRIKLEGWNKIDMIALFYYLRQEGVIENVSDIKLGQFIERFFCLEQNDKFEELTEINKKISGIKKQDVTISKSTDRIKKFFKNIDLKTD